MAKTYRDYTVAMTATYSVVVCAEDIFGAECLAMDMLDEEIKKWEIEEPDYFIVEEHRLPFCDDEYSIKIKANIVVPVESTSYEEAWWDAVQYIEDTVKMPEHIELIGTEQIDMALAEEKAYLQRKEVS